MAQAIPKRCTRCSSMAVKGGRCDAHQVKPWANKSANSRALTGRQREQLKLARLAIDPRCAVCYTQDINDLELDHIIEIADGGDPLDIDNCQLLCSEHHKSKTRIMRAARGSRPRTY